MRRSRFRRGDDFIEHRIKQPTRPLVPLGDLTPLVFDAQPNRRRVLVARERLRRVPPAPIQQRARCRDARCLAFTFVHDVRQFRDSSGSVLARKLSYHHARERSTSTINRSRQLTRADLCCAESGKPPASSSIWFRPSSAGAISPMPDTIPPNAKIL